ncbi:hypothetical protein B0H17DRAFT_188933 [Mycena rosella]|uniref:Uncharacterized protein n=1 Tax=Mycena rosella TaxID=1033263 RepID=A0AAD7GR05_MYCRO|nr:hypothetical protein B0H17DRAFT_188933 [Mycena rosella]
MIDPRAVSFHRNPLRVPPCLPAHCGPHNEPHALLRLGPYTALLAAVCMYRRPPWIPGNSRNAGDMYSRLLDTPHLSRSGSTMCGFRAKNVVEQDICGVSRGCLDTRSVGVKKVANALSAKPRDSDMRNLSPDPTASARTSSIRLRSAHTTRLLNDARHPRLALPASLSGGRRHAALILIWPAWILRAQRNIMMSPATACRRHWYVYAHVGDGAGGCAQGSRF